MASPSDVIPDSFYKHSGTKYAGTRRTYQEHADRYKIPVEQVLAMSEDTFLDWESKGFPVKRPGTDEAKVDTEFVVPEGIYVNAPELYAARPEFDPESSNYKGIVKTLTGGSTESKFGSVSGLEKEEGAKTGVIGDVTGAIDTAASGGQETVDIVTGEKAAEKEEEAIKRAEVIAEETKIEQQKIIGETKKEIIASNVELLKYADAKNIAIEKLLVDATTETAKDIIEALKNAKISEEKGLTDASKEILDGLNAAETHLLTGETGAKNEAITAITNASNRFKDTLKEIKGVEGESKGVFAPWIENGQWASKELKDRANELTRKFTLDDFQVDPVAQKRLEAGQKAILNYGSSVGVTGDTAKDLVEYSQEFVSHEGDKAYVRFRDFQNNATDYLSNISNQGKSAATQYADILTRTNENLANLDLEKGNTLSNYLRNTGIIKSDTERSRTGVRSDLTLGKTALGTGLIRDTAGVEAGAASDTGAIKAGTIQRGIDDRKVITGTENTLAAGLAGANINVTGNYGQSAGNLAIQRGESRANQAMNQANLINNTLKNYLFYRYSGVGGGGGAGGSGGGGTAIPNTPAFENVA